MAGDSPRFPDQIWFDAGNPGPLHEALRQDYARTKAAAERRPSLRRHLAECGTCAAIGAALAGGGPPSSGRRRMKLVLTQQLMHQLLGLPASFEIVHMFADDDPNIVSILVAGDELPEADPLAETPVVSPDAVSSLFTPKA